MKRGARTLCDWPCYSGHPAIDDQPCEAAADWETDDLGTVHHLCETHVMVAMSMNDFRVEPVNPDTERPVAL